MTGEFELYKDEADQYRFRFKAGGKTLLRSRAYKSKFNCTVGISAVRNCSPNADSFVSEQSGSGKQRFKLVAPNNRVLGVGLGKNEIALVQRLAPDARVSDRTLTVRQAEKMRAARAANNNWCHRIYAALRDHRGVYRPRDTAALIVQGFQSEDARNNYWNKWIRPVTADRAGARYEYVMCDYPKNGQWRFISERRYSNAKLIRGNV